MNEADELPLGDERCLTVRDGAKELQVLSRSINQFRVVTIDRVVSQHPQVGFVLTGRQVFERPDPKVTGSHAAKQHPENNFPHLKPLSPGTPGERGWGEGVTLRKPPHPQPLSPGVPGERGVRALAKKTGSY